jgi:hypothetical protein
MTGIRLSSVDASGRALRYHEVPEGSMWWLSPCVAVAGTLVIEATVPVDVVRGDSQQLVHLFVPGRAVVTIQVWVDGSPHDVTIVVPHDGESTLIVGETGITTDTPPRPKGEVGPVEFRVAGSTEVLLVVDDRKLRLGPNDVLRLDLSDGSHTISLRDASGTVVWAKGMLDVRQPRGVVVQMAEGRLPEVMGDGGRFVPDAK